MFLGRRIEYSESEGYSFVASTASQKKSACVACRDDVIAKKADFFFADTRQHEVVAKYFSHTRDACLDQTSTT